MGNILFLKSFCKENSSFFYFQSYYQCSKCSFPWHSLRKNQLYDCHLHQQKLRKQHQNDWVDSFVEQRQTLIYFCLVKCLIIIILTRELVISIHFSMIKSDPMHLKILLHYSSSFLKCITFSINAIMILKNRLL